MSGSHNQLGPFTAFVSVALVSMMAGAQDTTTRSTIQVQSGDLQITLRDNSNSPQQLSGLDSLFNLVDAAGFDAFDPDTPGASAGLNFEHIISGHRTANNKFTPRHGKYSLHVSEDGKRFELVRAAEDSPWSVESQFSYTPVEPNYIDFEFRCVPRDAAKFGSRGYAIFFFANYMNDVADIALNFRGHRASDAPETWIAATAPNEHPDWIGGGNYRALRAGGLEYDDDVEFRLNTWSYDWPRVSQPFYFGRAKNDMTFMLMFDRLHSERDQIRFSLYKFKLPKHPRPAWDFQYVIPHVKENANYGFRGRLVWKKFVSPDDCQREYEQWRSQIQADDIARLRQLGATVFTRNGAVVEVNANGTDISDRELEFLCSYDEMTDLSLERTSISGDGLACLTNLNKLEWLNLWRCKVGNEGLRHLRHLPSLQHLPIGDSQITDEGLHHLNQLPQLVYLGLRSNDVSDAGLKELKELKLLTGLHLGETKITDRGLVHLQNLPLQRLWLDDADISDEAVRTLASMLTLRELYVRRTLISEKAIGKLRAALRGCEVEWERR